MIVIGLTGSIGMGKSTASAMLRGLGVPVHDADATVHRLTGPGGAAVPAIEAAFPGATKDGAVDRAALGPKVFGDPAALKTLESILHPMVAADRDGFLKSCMLHGRRAAVLDVPLLFETGGERLCDLTIAVTAPLFIQAQRVLARPGMTPEKLRDIRARQMPEGEKRRRADIVIWSSLGRRPVLRALENTLKMPVVARNRWRNPHA
ncbi:MAG: dephospho-CoA kinase [Alphaproteobacteria bacterium]|nr:dephospho-CoA kinase [Alphaproteobacteria bacterium]